MRTAMIWSGTVLLTVGLMGSVGAVRVEAQVAYQPSVGTIADGVSLNATPVVSADRRYVRLSLNPSFQTVDGFKNIAIPFAASGLGSGTGAGAAAGALAGAGFPGAGGLRSVGVPMGMNGPVVGGGMGSTTPAGQSHFGAYPLDQGYVADEDAWSPISPRTRSARSKAARSKKAAAPVANRAKP